MLADKDITKAFSRVIDIFNRNDISYMIVGSVASMIYGEPRLTHDMDVVVQISNNDATDFISMFNTEEFYSPPIEIVQKEIQRHGQFNIVHLSTMYKIDMIIRKNKPHDLEQFKNRKQIPFWENMDAYIAAAEDVILKKLEFYREGKSEKHIRDIQSILRNTKIDQNYLDRWISALSLHNEWEKVKAST